MSASDKLLAQLERTSKRFAQREQERESSTRSMSEGDFLGANTDESMRTRLSRLGMAPEQTESVGTRGFEMPERHESESTRATIMNSVFERILGNNDLMPISHLLLGQHRSRSIGRIHIRDRSGRRLGYGTGFLVSPQLLLTNNHVLESTQDASSSIVEFDYEADLAGNIRETVSFPLNPTSFFLTDEDLDFTLVAVTANSDANQKPADWGWNRLLDEDGLIVKGEYVSIIQHPNGEAKQIAMRENRVIDLLDNFTHYKTDTAPGSSGSPVFNDQWEIVALHHAGVPERLKNGDIQSVDGRKWERWMGDHRIKWIANEGVTAKRIIDFVKQASGFSADQKKLRDELFESEPPLPEAIRPIGKPGDGPKTNAGTKTGAGQKTRTSRGPIKQPVTTTAPAISASGATWTIPLQVTVNIGSGQMAATTPDDSGTTLVSINAPGASQPTSEPSEPSDLQQALDDLADARSKPYFDADKDQQDRDAYYSSIDSENLSRSALFKKLSELLEDTHATRPTYKPSKHVYPFVDLHPDLKLRSIYSGKSFEAEELIREDFRIEQERAQLLQELMQRESEMSEESFQEEMDFVESQNPFNCEHVVPQSWYQKQEPMRGDLHHLFACETGCNSFRSNIPYFDFSDFEEATRTECGKRIGKKFEPESGKGEVARATLYFLLRYPEKINDSSEFPAERISILLKWHGDHPVSEYEHHRNQAIFAQQGNRNPLIDHPDWAGKIKFELGLG